MSEHAYRPQLQTVNARMCATVDLLRGHPKEGAWFEFKTNWWDPKKIGRHVSALSNGAALSKRPFGYLVWGVTDGDHRVVGTTLGISRQKIGNEPIEPYLKRMVSPEVDLRLYEIEHEGQKLSVLRVAAALNVPTAFEKRRWVRIDSYTKDLADYPDTEIRLFDVLRRTPFEKRPAMEEVTGSDVLDLLDDAAFLRMQGTRRPTRQSDLLLLMEDADMVRQTDSGRWDVSNLGALLFSRRLDAFDGLQSRQLRIIQYSGDSRVEAHQEPERPAGYAVDFEGTIDLLNSLLPSSERIGKAHRLPDRMYPEPAVRELFANMLIHQDLSSFGLCPKVEIFKNRIEFSNPGAPAVEADRLLDKERSRNVLLARTMRRYTFCEERGSGIDRVVGLTEVHQLPPPEFIGTPDSTKAVLHAHRAFSTMATEEKLRACYLHVALQYLEERPAGNESLRDRFGLGEEGRSATSRLLSEAKASGRIKEHAASAGRYVTYVPFWA